MSIANTRRTIATGHPFIGEIRHWGDSQTERHSCLLLPVGSKVAGARRYGAVAELKNTPHLPFGHPGISLGNGRATAACLHHMFPQSTDALRPFVVPALPVPPHADRLSQIRRYVARVNYVGNSPAGILIFVPRWKSPVLSTQIPLRRQRLSTDLVC